MEMIESLKAAGVVPVIVIDKEEQAVPLAKALVKGGLKVLEVTFRTPAAAGAIARIRAEVPEAVVGAGTLLTPHQVHAAHAAGAAFGVAPGSDPAAYKVARELGMPFVPGVATASELSQALTAGFSLVKFFPAEAAGGATMIRNLLGAFRFTGVKFMPTGGVNAENLGDYFGIPEVVAVGGTWVVPKKALADGDWAAVERLAAEASSRVRALRAVAVGAAM